MNKLEIIIIIILHYVKNQGISNITDIHPLCILNVYKQFYANMVVLEKKPR